MGTTFPGGSGRVARRPVLWLALLLPSPKCIHMLWAGPPGTLKPACHWEATGVSGMGWQRADNGAARACLPALTPRGHWRFLSTWPSGEPAERHGQSRRALGLHPAVLGETRGQAQ